MRAKKSGGRILVGTASWTDPGFVEHWYPQGMPAADRLSWYAEQFEMVEVNSTFYAIPAPQMVERWCRRTPNEFVFDVKLHQLLSRHSTAAKLLPPAIRQGAEVDGKGKVKLTPKLESAMLEEFLGLVKLLDAFGKLGPLLLQMSPAFSPKAHQLDELDSLFDALKDYRLAVELRNRNWAERERLPETLEFFRARKVSLVAVDAPTQEHFTIMPPALNDITNRELAYLRLHGRDPKAYLTGKTVAARFNYDYDDAEIGEVAERATELATEAQQVHVVFNNNALDYAPHAALRMRQALGQIAQAPARQTDLFAAK